MLLLRVVDKLSDKAANRLAGVFAAGGPTSKLQALWRVKEQAQGAATRQFPGRRSRSRLKEELKVLVEDAGRPETNKLYRSVWRWWNKSEVLIITGATTGKVDANNTGIKHITRTAGGYRNAGNYKSVIFMTGAVRTAG